MIDGRATLLINQSINKYIKDTWIKRKRPLVKGFKQFTTRQLLIIKILMQYLSAGFLTMKEIEGWELLKGQPWGQQYSGNA